MSKILVTGGAGFIGSNLVDTLIDRSHEVFVIDNLSTGNLSNLNPRATFYQQEITNPLNDIFDKFKFDYVFHLAAQINLRRSIREPANDAFTNILGSLNIIENCARTKVKRIIFSSTGGAIYSPDQPLPFTEESLAKPESPYGLAKLTVEKYLEIFHKIYDLQYTALRYSNVFGPRQDTKGEAGVIAIFIEKALKNEDITIFGDGTQTRDFVYVNDVVAANVLALEQEIDGIYNVCSNVQYSVNEIAKIILDKMTTTSKIVHTTSIPGEMLHTLLNAQKLQEKGWKKQWLITRGIEETIKYFADQMS